MAIAQVCERREVPFVVDVGAADQITTSGFTKVFRIFPTTTALGKNGAAYLSEIIRRSGERVERGVVTYTKDLFGTVVSKAFLQAMEEAKSPVKIVEVIGYDLTVQDLSTEVAKIKAARPDVLLPFNRIRDSVMLVRELYKQRVPLKGILSPGSPGWYEKEFIEQTGPLGEFAMDAPPWYNPKSPLYGRVEAAFRQHSLLDDATERSHVLIAAIRYLAAHSPTVRAQGQTYTIAQRLHRGERLFEGD